EGKPVFLIAKGYPERDPLMQITGDLLKKIEDKALRVYVEYPSAYEGLEIGETVLETRLERGVITSDRFGSSLPPMSLLGLHHSHVLPVAVDDPLIVLAKVVGFDKAEF